MKKARHQHKEAKRCLRTHPSTVTAGLLPLGPDPVRLDPPRLETAFRPRLTRRKTQGRIIQWISSIASPSAFECRFPRQPRHFAAQRTSHWPSMGLSPRYTARVLNKTMAPPAEPVNWPKPSLQPVTCWAQKSAQNTEPTRPMLPTRATFPSPTTPT